VNVESESDASTETSTLETIKATASNIKLKFIITHIFIATKQVYYYISDGDVKIVSKTKLIPVYPFLQFTKKCYDSNTNTNNMYTKTYKFDYSTAYKLAPVTI
jgi:hypothetical protein